MPGSSAYLQAEIQGKHYVLSRTPSMAPDAREAFTSSWVAFLDIYNAT